jgi:hypothetical protein
MPWVQFSSDYDHTPVAMPNVTVAYLAGMTRNVTRECAARAVLKGAAQLTKNPEIANDSVGATDTRG